MKAGKHVYCEKPLTHSVAEARELRELARGSKVVTQMGNQGSASASLRRCTEIIKAGALGQIRRDLPVGHRRHRPRRQRARAKIPFRPASTGTCGSARRPCALSRRTSIIRLPVARLVRLRQRRPGRFLLPRHQPAHAGAGPGLSRADRRQTWISTASRSPGKPAVEFHFPARGKLVPLRLYWQGNGMPPADGAPAGGRGLQGEGWPAS